MSLNNGGVIDETDFITQAERNATPSADVNRVPQLEADGRLSVFFTRNGAIPNAGETLNGATLPVPVFQNKTDNELYACDANDPTKYKYIGFVTSNGTDGNPCTFQGSGVVSGFTGLQEGEKYYVQDAVGTIGTTPGTQEILVGIAISETQLLIQKGKLRASGTLTLTATANTAITCGFRPSIVRISALGEGGTSDSLKSSGGYMNGQNNCAYLGSDGSAIYATGVSAIYAWYIRRTDNSRYHRGTVNTVTDTGFTLSNEKLSTIDDVVLYWEAEGEL